MKRYTSFLLLSVAYVWQSVHAGILENAFDTVQKTLRINQIADRLATESTEIVSNDNLTSNDPTSVHFKNQDFKIVLGESGLKALDSILDRVFNFTNDLHERNERYGLMRNGINSINTDSIEKSGSSTDSRGSIIPPEELDPEPLKFLDALNTDSDVKANKSSREHDSGHKKRRRPILTEKDAPFYYDAKSGLLKPNNFEDEIPVDYASARAIMKPYVPKKRSKSPRRKVRPIKQVLELPTLGPEEEQQEKLHVGEGSRRDVELSKEASTPGVFIDTGQEVAVHDAVQLSIENVEG